MLSLTIQQCIDANDGLSALARLPFPMRLGIRIAQLRFAVLQVAQRVDEVQQERYAQLAAKDDTGAPIVTRTNAGLTYDLTPAQLLQAQREYQLACKEPVELDAIPLGLADFPDGDKTVVTPEILIALGPLFLP